MRKRCFLLCLFLASLVFAWDWKVTEIRQKGMDMLDNAIKQSSKGSYIAEISNPSFPEFNGLGPLMQKPVKAVYYRRPREDGGLDLALELYGKSGMTLRFVQNSEGRFVHSPVYNISAKGGMFLRLYSLMALYNDFHLQEKKNSEYEFGEAEYSGRPCMKLDMFISKEIINDSKYVYGITGSPAPDFKDYFVTRPCHRTILIDKENGQIVSIREFNINGQCISDMNLGKVDFTPNWKKHPDVFATPANPELTVMTTKDFIDILGKDLLEKYRKKAEKKN